MTAARARARTRVRKSDEPHVIDKDAGDEYDPSAPAMHVPAREEYDERECFGAGSEEKGQF